MLLLFFLIFGSVILTSPHACLLVGMLMVAGLAGWSIGLSVLISVDAIVQF